MRKIRVERTQFFSVLALMCISALSTSAQAATYTILNTSVMNNVQRVGGGNYFNAATTTSDLSTWNSLMWTNVSNTTLAQNGAGNSTTLNGTISVSGGVVTGATINQLDQMSLAAYQSDTVQANILFNGLIWTLSGGTLTHQADAGLATCSVVVGRCPGQGSVIVGDVNGSSDRSPWNFDGVIADFTIGDTSTTPWHTATGDSHDIGPIGALAFDLSNFVDGVGGVIEITAVGDQSFGGFSGAVAPTYTLDVQLVPVPAAVWLFGSALGLLGWVKRRN